MDDDYRYQIFPLQLAAIKLRHLSEVCKRVATVRLKKEAQRDGLHVLELFVDVGLGVLRAALSAQYVIRCYIYVNHDPISRRIAKEVLQHLQRQYPDQLPLSATLVLKETTPISRCIGNILQHWQFVTRHGLVDLLGGSWECQSVNRAGKQQGAEHLGFRYFFNLVAIINFLWREQASPLNYLLGTPILGSAVLLQ